MPLRLVQTKLPWVVSIVVIIRRREMTLGGRNLERRHGELPLSNVPYGGKSKRFISSIYWNETKRKESSVDKAQKREFVSTMNEAFSSAGAVVVAHYTGLTVSDMSELRSQMREAGGTVKVAKNSLAKLALQGTEVEHISELFTGQNGDLLF